MAWLGMPLKLPLLTTYHIKHNGLDFETLNLFLFDQNTKLTILSL